MNRTKYTHKVFAYDHAVIDAYEWVCEEGGILIFGTKQLMRMGQDAIYKKLGKQRVVSDSKADKFHVGVARGEDYLLCGPRIAIIDGTDLDMRRIEMKIGDNDGDWITELRSYTKADTLDTHKEWTQKYAPETIDIDYDE